ncbi:hypothetical protein EYF80_054942 [Liparis tanakae]|uniref:Uncharacterized protein n=1 Tax=Liparis tanakae TaxID=230148 RepID=A0A4Z2F1Q0_9TELE|nr:hypothetical protein EYF80_054942 [Liparis tanakae]
MVFLVWVQEPSSNLGLGFPSMALVADVNLRPVEPVAAAVCSVDDHDGGDKVGLQQVHSPPGVALFIRVGAGSRPKIRITVSIDGTGGSSEDVVQAARAVHLHLTQSQNIFSRDDHVDVTTVHPIALELFDSTRRDAVDHGAPGGKRQKCCRRTQDANEETVRGGLNGL